MSTYERHLFICSNFQSNCVCEIVVLKLFVYFYSVWATSATKLHCLVVANKIIGGNMILYLTTLPDDVYLKGSCTA